MNSSVSKKRINSFTGLRFYMMIIIMLSHMQFLSLLHNGYVYSRFFHNAYVAVNFFFILSGFGLAYSYKCNEHLPQITLRNSISYGIKRVKKIYPVYFILLFVCLPYCLYLSISDGNTIIVAFCKTIFKLILDIFLVQSSTGILQLSTGINSVGWFLSTLFLLYICCPLLLKLNEKIKNSLKAVSLFWGINLALIIIFYYIFEAIESRTFFDSLSYTSPYLRIFYLISGILLCDMVKLSKRNLNAFNTFSETVIVLLNILWFVFRNSITIDIHIKYIVDFLLCVLLIYIFAFERGYISKALSNSFHVKAGNNTMYWFLIHYPIRLYVHAIFSFFSPAATWYIGIIEVTIIFVLTFLVTNIITGKKHYSTDTSMK